MANDFSALFNDAPSPNPEPSVGNSTDEFDDLFNGSKPRKPKTVTPSKSLSQAELEDVARKAGWPEPLVPTMGAIGMGESAHDKSGRALINSYNPGVGHGGKATTEQSVGLWQINMHPSLGRTYDRQKLANDPVYNAKVALELYNQRQKQGKDGFTHWGAYTDGGYKKYLGKGGDPFQSLFGDTGRSPSGAPEVSMNVGGVAEPPAPSEQATRSFEQLFGKKVPRLNTTVPPAVPVEAPPALNGGQGQLPAAPETAVAPPVPSPLIAPQVVPQVTPPTTQVTAPPSPVIAPQVTKVTPQVTGALPPQTQTPPVTAPTPPTSPWLRGTTPPKTPLPQDPALQKAYQQRLDQGVPDSEELRQKFLQGYQAVKSGQQVSIFTPEDRQALDQHSAGQSPQRPYSENDFAQWAAFNKVAPTPESRTEFEKQLQGSGPGSVDVSAETGAPSDQSAVVPAGHYADTSLSYDLRNKPANQTNKEFVNSQIAGHIADQYGVPLDIAKRVVESQPVQIGQKGEGGAADERYFQGIAKTGGVGQTHIGGSVVRQAVEAANREKDVNARVDAVLQKQGDDPTQSPVALRMRAEAEAGVREVDPYGPLNKEDTAYSDWLEKTGYNKPEYRDSHSQEFTRDREAVLKQFGSFDALSKQRERTNEYYKDKPYSIALGLGPEYDASVAATQLYNRTRLSDEDINNAKELGQGIKGYNDLRGGGTGTFAGQFITTALADLARMGAGAERLLKYANPLIAVAEHAGITDPTDLEKFARKAEIVGETAQGDGAYFHYTGLAGRGTGGLPGLAIATVAGGGNPIIGFGIHAALSNTDKPIAEQIKGVATDVALGAAFSGIGAFGKYIGSKAAGVYLTPEVVKALDSPAAENEFLGAIKDKALKMQALAERGATEGEKTTAKNVLAGYLERNGLTPTDLAPDAVPEMNPVLQTAMRRAAITKAVAEKGTSIGSVAAVGYGTAKLEGQSDEKAGEQALLWGAMEVAMGVLHKNPKEPWTPEDIAAASDRVVRVPDAEGKPRDILLISDGERLIGHDVTGTVPPDAPDAQILPKPGKKSVEAPSKNWAQDIHQTVAESDLAKSVQTPNISEAPGKPEAPLTTDLQTQPITEVPPVAGETQTEKQDTQNILQQFGQHAEGSPQGLGFPKDSTPAETALVTAQTEDRRQTEGTTEGRIVGGGEMSRESQRRVNAEREAETDPLTGLASRRALDRALPQAEADPNTSVIAFDANNFGQINKAHGHEEGDKILRDIGMALRFAAENDGGRAFRSGGDEFTILAPKDKAEQIRKDAEDYVGELPYKGFTVSLSGSVGDTFADADSRLQAIKAERKAPQGKTTQPITPTQAESDITAPAPTDFVGKTVDVEGVGLGRLADIRGNKAVVDHNPRTVGGQTVYGKRSFFPLDQVKVDSGRLSDFIQNEPVRRSEGAMAAAPAERVPEGSSVAEERRKAGSFERDGVVYTRQPVINETTHRGNEGQVKFSNEEEPKFHYQLIEAKQLQPADLGGNPNPNHFLPEAQPKDRSGKASAKASDKIAAKLKLNEVGANPIAYSGAPVTNSRGEAIQGNNRSEGIIKSYNNGDVGYKQQLAEKAGEFGFTADQVHGMKEPVLVRMLDVADKDAIRLGNYDVKDIETGGKISVNPVATAARVSFEDKHAMLQDVFYGAREDSTLNQLIKDNSDRIAKHLEPYVTEAQTESLYRKNTHELTPQGAKDIEQLFTHFLFDKGDPRLSDVFADPSFPFHARNAIVGSLPKIFGVPQDASLVPDIQNAIVAASNFSETNIPNFNDWSRQTDMFAKDKAPVDVLTPIEMELARLFVERSQKEIKSKFADYAEAVNGTHGDLFGQMAEPLDKMAAIRKVFGVEYSKDTKYQTKDQNHDETQSVENAGHNEGPAAAETSPTAETAGHASETEVLRGQPETVRPEEGDNTGGVQQGGETSVLKAQEQATGTPSTEGGAPAVQTNAVAPDMSAMFDDLVPPTTEEKAAVAAAEKSAADIVRNQEVLGEDVSKNLQVLADAPEQVPVASKAANAVLGHAAEITKKGRAALDLAAEALSAIDAYARQEMSGMSPAAFFNLSPAARSMYDQLKNGDFADSFRQTLEALGDGTVFAPASSEYIGPNMTTVEIGRHLSTLLQGNVLPDIKTARKIVGDLLGEKVEAGTPLAKRVDEAVETAVVLEARRIVRGTGTDTDKYKALTTLYENQPNLNVRTSTSIEQQAYSTPAPLAYIASRLAGINLLTTVYEPAAGNGMLLMEATPENILANEINRDRAENLHDISGDGTAVSTDDATAFNAAAGEVDTVITNPPFGTVQEGGKEKTWPINDRYTTNQIDHAIALRSLEAMKQDGRAVLIVGGVKGDNDADRSKGYQSQNKRAFYKTLYDNYNVTDHFTVHGDLYKKQGAGFPVDVILIEGRGKSDKKLPAIEVPRVFDSWPDLGEKLNERTDTGITEVGLSGLDAEGRRGDTANGRGGDETRPPDQGSLLDLLGGEGGSVSKRGAKPEKGAGLSGTAATGKRSPGPRRDFSDSSEHGDLADSGQSADARAPGKPGRDIQVTKPIGSVRPERGEDTGGHGPGELAGESAGVKEALASAGESTKQSLDEAVQGLADLFGDPNTLGSGPVFSEETYQKAKPHFRAAYEHFKAAARSAADAMRMLIEYLKARGWTVDALRRMKDYIIRFVEEIAPELEGEKQQTRQKLERPEITPEMAASSTQLVYVPQSGGQPMDTLLPANLYNATVNALEKLEKEVGNIDDYVVNKLGYRNNGEIYAYFGGEQIDAIALAVYNMENGGALVLGDQTGVGKGRVVAGLLKYAMREDMIPVFFTEKDNLYKDIYRDLVDIGMTNISPLMVDANKAIALDDSKTVWLKTNSKHNDKLKQMMNSREIDPAYNIVFATYYGLQLPNVRRDFLRQFAQNTIVVMDESHNAGGDGAPPKTDKDGNLKMNRALTAREIVQNAKGVLYSSATWAKRPDVMSLYAKTDMKLAVADPESLGPAIDAGGVPLQQVVSAMLAESGQYLRRERDFEGINYETPIVEVNKNHAENLSKAIRDIFGFSEGVKSALSKPGSSVMDDLLAEGGAVLNNPAVNAEAIGFAQTMHNVIAQMLLALKVDAAVDEAIADLKANHKPVLTMANTMGALIEEYAGDNNWTPGDTVQIDFGAVLRRYLDKSRHVRVGSAFGDSETIRLTDDQLGALGLLQMHDGVKKWIDTRDWSELPASPIDYMHSRLQAAGYKTAEITGRSHALQYNPDGTVVYRIRPGKEKTVQGKTDTILGFNNGDIDVLLLNQSGSTGLSLHASEKFKDQRKRVMTLAQAEGNIDTHMQILGRVNRTGQIVKPGYKQLTADIPAEKRPAAVLSKKMASLNANTTGAIDSAVKSKDTLDFINAYGDQIVAQYLADNPSIHAAIGAPLKSNDSGSGFDTQDAARKATGRLPMLTLAEQEEFYDVVGAMYESYIDQLNQLGENKLEAQTLPLEAVTTSRLKVFDGPGGDSPFGQDAYAETITAKKLTKPRSQAEVLKILQDRLNSGHTDMRNLMAAGRERTSEWWREQLGAIRPYIESELDKLDDADKINTARTRLEGLKRRLQNALAVAHIGSTVEVKYGSEYYYGVVSDVRRMGRSKSLLALSDYEFTILTTDASRQLHIPGSQAFTNMNPAPPGTQLSATFVHTSSQPAEMGSRVPIMDAFDHGQNVRTEERTMMTGNLLASFSQFENGRVINFTTKDGQIRQGILMPMKFNIEKAMDEQPVAFRTSDQIIQFLREGTEGRIVEDKSGEVRISHRRGDFSLMVPKAKARGARFYNNKEILDIADNDFASSGQQMYLRYLNESKAHSIVDVLNRMGLEFHTNVFKPAAREIVGTDLPEREDVAYEQDQEQIAYKAAVAERKAAEIAQTPFETAEFNHTRTGAQMFVAKYRDDGANRSGNDFVKWVTIAKEHGGYYSGYARDGAVPGFLFKKDIDRQAFLDAAKPDLTMFSVADEEEQNRRNAVRILKNVPLTDLIPATNVVRTGDRIKLNLAAMELLRRAFGENRNTPYPTFMGAFTDPRAVERAAGALMKVADDAHESGNSLWKPVQKIVEDLRSAAAVGKGTVILYVLDSKLPQEIFHQGVYLGSADKALTARHADAKGLDNSPQFKTADKTFFSKQPEYSIDNIMKQGLSLTEARDHRNAVIREEVAAWIAEGSHDKLGLTMAEGDAYLLQFMRSFAGKVYADARREGKTDSQASAEMANALSRFEEIDYAKNAIKTIIGDEAQSPGQDNEEGPTDIEGGGPPRPTESTQGGTRETKQDVVPPLGALPEGFEPSTDIRPEPDAGSLYPATKTFPGVRGKFALSRLPKTMRAAGLATNDVLATVFSDKAAQAEAERFIAENGYDGAFERLMDPEAIPLPDVHHAIAAFTIQKVLQDESVRIEETDPRASAELLNMAKDLGRAVVMRMRPAGRFIRAAGVLAKNTLGILETATAIYQEKYGLDRSLPIDVKDRIQAKSQKSTSDLAQYESLVTQLRNAEAENERLKKTGTESNRATKHILAKRRDLVTQVKTARKEELDKAVKFLQSQSLVRSVFKIGKDGLPGTSMFSIFDEPTLPEDTAKAFAEVGADILLDGLASPDPLTPEEFDERMKAMFGDVIIPHLDNIHRDSLALRNDLIANLSKEKEVQKIIKEFGDDLSDEEIEAVIENRGNELKRRAAIRRSHTARAKVETEKAPRTSRSSKAARLTKIEAIIAELAPSPAAAVAATEILRNKPTATELNETLEVLGYTGAEARDAVRQGSDVLDRAKKAHADYEKEIKAEIQGRLAENDDSIRELQELATEAKIRSQVSQKSLQKELNRISSGEVKYRLQQASEVLNTARSIMVIGPVHLFRHGGWFLVNRPSQQAAMFKAAWGAFAALTDPYAQAKMAIEMEKDPFFAAAQQFGLDFSTLGRHAARAIGAGEEETRNNAFKMLSGLTEGTEAHKFNPARVPAAILRMSDAQYSLGLDAQRLAIFGSIAQQYLHDGLTYSHDPQEFKALAEYINDAIGRSSLGGSKVENFVMNMPLFAPRFKISRFKLLYKSTAGIATSFVTGGRHGLPPHTRNVVMRDASIFYGAVAGLLTLAVLAGFNTSLDWDNPDFLKLRIGDRHYDVLLGLQQPLRVMLRATTAIGRKTLGSRLSGGLFRDSVHIEDKDENVKLDEFTHDMGLNEKSIPVQFLRSSLAPGTSLATDWVMGDDLLGRKFNWRRALLSRTTPISAQEMYHSIAADGPVAGTFYALPALAIGDQQYEPRSNGATTPAEKIASKINSMRFGSTVRTDKQEDIDGTLNKLKVQGRAGTDIKPTLDALVAAGTITTEDRARTIKAQETSLFSAQIRSMPTEMLKSVRAVANDGEKAVLDALIEKRGATKEKKDERAEARQQLFGDREKKPSAPKSLADELNHASVEESLILYQTHADKLSSEQRFEVLRKIKQKVLNSNVRGTLTRERFDAAKKLLGDDLKMQFHEPRQKVVKPVRGLDTLTGVQ